MQFFGKIFFLSIIFILFTMRASAQGYSISPVKMLVTADPAVNQTVMVKIYNSEKTDLTFKLNVFGTKQDEAGLPVFERGVSEAETWVFPEQNSIKIKSGETKSANFIIRVPQDAAPGSYYLGLAVEPMLENASPNALTSRLVSLLTLQVKGVVKESLVIETWDFDKSSLTDQNWKFRLGLDNNGDVEVPFQGTIAIKNWRGEEILAKPIVLGNKLLAGSRRALLPQIDVKNNISLPGIYQAKIQVNYGLTNQTVSAIDYVWYFPTWSKLIAIIVSLALILLVFSLVKRLAKR